MDTVRNMGQDHRKKQRKGKIRESERPLHEEIPRPGQDSKDGEEGQEGLR